MEGTAQPYVFILWDGCCCCCRAYCGQCGEEQKKGEEEIAAQETERLVILTYSWTALNCCTSEKRAGAIQRAKRQTSLGKLIIIVMVTWGGMWGKLTCVYFKCFLCISRLLYLHWGETETPWRIVFFPFRIWMQAVIKKYQHTHTQTHRHTHTHTGAGFQSKCTLGNTKSFRLGI